MNPDWINALTGGILIGLAVSIMLLFNGRVTGISGIVYGLLNPKKEDVAWRLYFMAGLLIGGLILQWTSPAVFGGSPANNWYVLAAGLIVGFGTVLGSGCTSGHGVCGISRLSLRSLVATLVFVSAGFLSVALFKNLGVLP